MADDEEANLICVICHCKTLVKLRRVISGLTFPKQIVEFLHRGILRSDVRASDIMCIDCFYLSQKVVKLENDLETKPLSIKCEIAKLMKTLLLRHSATEAPVTPVSLLAKPNRWYMSGRPIATPTSRCPGELLGIKPLASGVAPSPKTDKYRFVLPKAKAYPCTSSSCQTSGCMPFTAIKTEPFDDPTHEKVSSGEVTPSLQFCEPGNVTQPKNSHVDTIRDYRFLDTATKNRSTQTNFDPSDLIFIDPAHVIVMDPSQVLDLHLSQMSGFNPAEIPGFNPSQIPGYDSSEEYRAVYVNWNQRVCGEPVEPMDDDQADTPDTQRIIQSKRTSLQNLICSLENVMPNIEQVIRFTENIQAARDKILEVLDSIKVSCPLPTTESFISAMQTIVDAASTNVLDIIKQLANTTRQQQTQYLHLAGFVQKIQKEQREMEEELLKFRRMNLRVRCTSDRKRTLAPEYRQANFRKMNITCTDISKRKNNQKSNENVQSRQIINTTDCSKKKSELYLTSPEPFIETNVLTIGMSKQLSIKR